MSDYNGLIIGGLNKQPNPKTKLDDMNQCGIHGITRRNIFWFFCQDLIVTRYPMIGLKKSNVSLILCEIQIFYNNIGKYKIFDSFKTYHAAKETCSKYFNGDLIKIETKDEYDFVQSNIFKKHQINFDLFSGHTNFNKNNLYSIHESQGIILINLFKYSFFD